MSRFLKPELVRIDLTLGDWILIKKRLTAGEQRRVFARMVKTMKAGEGIEIDPERAGLSNLVEYLVDWSFTDVTGAAGARSRTRRPSSSWRRSTTSTPTATTRSQKAISDHEAALDEEKKSPGYRERIVSDLRICRVMHWTYDDVLNLPVDVYDILVDELTKEADGPS